MSECVWQYTESTFLLGWQRKKAFVVFFPLSSSLRLRRDEIWGRFSFNSSSRPAKPSSRGQQVGGHCRTAWLIHLRYSLIIESWKAFKTDAPTILNKKMKADYFVAFFLLAWDWMLLIMKDRTNRRRQSPGNSYRFSMDNNPSFSLSLFLLINREGFFGHENASAEIQFSKCPNVRGRKRKCSAGNSFHVGLFVPLRRRPWNPSLYWADHGHSHLGQTELFRFSRESPSARYGIQGLNPGRKISSFHRYFTFVADLKKILSCEVGVSGRFSFFTRSLVAFYFVNG